MKKHYIKNFVDMNAIIVQAQKHPSCGDLVSITQSEGSMHFQHDMTITQTRQLCDALLACCDDLEGVTA